MAIYSCNISNVSRGKGSSSCATLSYITAEKIHDERLGVNFNYGRSERVVLTQTMLPENAPSEYQNSEVLFNSIECFEKSSNARTAKKIMVALPKEFDIETQKEVLQSYIKHNLNDKGYACTYAIHTDKNNNNPHAHILVASRPINKNGGWGAKYKKDFALDKDGKRIPIIDNKTGEQKIGKNGRREWKRVNVEFNALDSKQTLKSLRKAWADECNQHLSQDFQIDHRSYADRGLDNVPTIHEGYAAREIEKRGGISERCESNREIQIVNIELKKLHIRYKQLQKVQQENEKKVLLSGYELSNKITQSCQTISDKLIENDKAISILENEIVPKRTKRKHLDSESWEPSQNWKRMKTAALSTYTKGATTRVNEEASKIRQQQKKLSAEWDLFAQTPMPVVSEELNSYMAKKKSLELLQKKLSADEQAVLMKADYIKTELRKPEHRKKIAKILNMIRNKNNAKISTLNAIKTENKELRQVGRRLLEIQAKYPKLMKYNVPQSTVLHLENKDSHSTSEVIQNLKSAARTLEANENVLPKGNNMKVNFHDNSIGGMKI